MRTTARMYLGGAFVPSESGRTYATEEGGHAFLGSRKDLRDAVAAALAAADAWAGLAPLERGRALYRVAAHLEARAEQLGADAPAAVDRWVFYAGWADKLGVLAGAVHGAWGPYVSVSAPAPVGVVGALAPQDSPLLGFVGVLAPALAAGATAVVVAAEARPAAALAVAECLAVAGLPAGVANILTGRAAELGPALAAHGGIAALDLAGAPEGLAPNLEAAAAEGMVQVLPPGSGTSWDAEPGPARLLLACAPARVWTPVGA